VGVPGHDVVVVGASAGGIEALSVLVGTLPAGFPAPIVVAQHLDPTRVSHLREILSRTSTLPIRTVEARERLEPGVVYVVPASQDVAVTDHEVSLSEGRSRSQPSIDLLFGSAAAVFGENLFAVILTGAGSDGADGARRVKEHGGTVIIQNPQTARFPSMPLSLPPTIVDIIADLEAIGPLVHDLLIGAYTPPAPEEDRRMRGLLDQLRARVGIDFSSYRQPTIQRRLQRRMADTGRETLDEYIRYLQRHPDEYQRLANSFLIKVTDFFRDPELYAHLRQRILPELIADARTRGNELRFWSAGCATGEEAYSLAILIADVVGDAFEEFNVRLFATDLNADSIAFAGRGVYPPAALTNVPPDLLARYFTQLDGGYEVRKLVRRTVVFGQHDLGQRAPFPRIDLVLCRNVLIYFTPELQRRALQLFAFSLRRGGHLVLGKSETTSPLPEYFAVGEPRLKIYRRHGERALLAPTEIVDAVPRGAAAGGGAIAMRVEGALPRTRAGRQPSTSAERADRLILDLPVGVVVVDRRYDIQAVNAAARTLLGIHTAAIGEDLIHLAHRLPAPRLRGALDRALRGQPSVERFEVPGMEGADGGRHLDLSFYPQRSEPTVPTFDRVTVIVADGTEAAASAQGAAAAPPTIRQALEEAAERLRALAEAAASPSELGDGLSGAVAALRAGAAELERLGALVREVETSRQEVLAANQELTAANELLRTENEGLLFGNEESQAAVEEIETLNEEQQATNEELETLNEELQATVEELNATNDDLEARGAQLAQAGAELEAERSRLAAVLAAMPDAVLVVDARGRVLLANAAFERLFGRDGVELHPEDDQGRPLDGRATPRARLARGESFTLQFGQTRPDRTRRRYEATGHPISAGTQDGGGVLVIRDITDRRPHT
jgi:two-component system CheB/CheR fusion protein